MTGSSGSADRFLELTLCTCVPVVIHEAINFFIHRNAPSQLELRECEFADSSLSSQITHLITLN